MCVVCRGYGWLVARSDGLVDYVHAGQSEGGWSHVGRCRSASRVRGEDTDDSQSDRHPRAPLWVRSIRNLSLFLKRF